MAQARRRAGDTARRAQPRTRTGGRLPAVMVIVTAAQPAITGPAGRVREAGLVRALLALPALLSALRPGRHAEHAARRSTGGESLREQGADHYDQVQHQRAEHEVV